MTCPVIPIMRWALVGDATRCATCHKRVEVVGAEVATEPTPDDAR